MIVRVGLAVAVLAVVGCGGSMQTQLRYGGNVSLTLVNDTDRAACYVRMSPTFDQEWGDDWLGSEEVIPRGAERSFGIAPQSTWDVRVEDCEHETLSERRSLPMTTPARLAISNLSPTTATGPGPGPVNPIHPVDPNQPPSGAPCNVNGTYTGGGADMNAMQWTWTMTLVQSGLLFEGTIDWRSTAGSSGRERIRGSIDCNTHAINATGYALENAVGITQNVYVGTFDGDFRAVQGTWSGGNGGRFWGNRQPTP